MTNHRPIRKESARTEIFPWGSLLWLIEDGERMGYEVMSLALDVRAAKTVRAGAATKRSSFWRAG